MNFLPAWRRWPRASASTGCSCQRRSVLAISRAMAFSRRTAEGFHLRRRSSSSRVFAKGEAEQQLNRGLHERNVNRVILDSRPVHSAAATSPAMIDAQQKKPKVPVHAVMTARQPMVRFIGGDDMAHNRELFRVWLQTRRSGISRGPRGCSCIPRTLLSPRRWWIPCG